MSNRRRQFIGTCFTFIYIILAIIAVVFTYSLIYDLVKAMNHPVRSIHYRQVKEYEAPGIVVYPGGAELLACGHYFNNIVTSKVRLTDLDLVNRNCSYVNITYKDPVVEGLTRNAVVFRGPSTMVQKEAVFLHFQLEDETRDFFTVSYFVFPGWDAFNSSTTKSQASELKGYHKVAPTYALSSGLRMWMKLSMKDTYMLDGHKHTEFKIEYSVVRHWERRNKSQRHKHLFFIFYEWKNDFIEESFLVYTTTPWNIGAALCGVFLTLHKGYQLAQTSYKRMKKDKQRRRTIRQRRQERSRDFPRADTV
ncbi:proton-activated chloride channel-like [Tubulanus polymorphus]|uniref:proton-activated chloride channel-like n=1 Tax=Tubulanus polymorphus TaxID=672921 RepID=UPI003DA3D319